MFVWWKVNENKTAPQVGGCESSNYCWLTLAPTDSVITTDTGASQKIKTIIECLQVLEAEHARVFGAYKEKIDLKAKLLLENEQLVEEKKALAEQIAKENSGLSEFQVRKVNSPSSSSSSLSLSCQGETRQSCS